MPNDHAHRLEKRLNETLEILEELARDSRLRELAKYLRSERLTTPAEWLLMEHGLLAVQRQAHLARDISASVVDAAGLIVKEPAQAEARV
jgi:hypothetical protein